MQGALAPSSLDLSLAGLENTICVDIIQNISLIHNMLSQLGLPTRAYTPLAIKRLLSLSKEEQLEVQSGLNRWTQVLMSITNGTDIRKIDEVTLAERALSHFNFKLKNHTWETSAREEVIEIYNPQGIQLYRSLNFFKTCGYSLLDLCVNQWFVLWERPRKAIEGVNNAIQEVLSGKHPEGFKMNVPTHIIRETYNDGMTQPFYPRSLLVDFKNMYPTYSVQGEISGFVLTCSCKVVSIGDEALKLDFI